MNEKKVENGNLFQQATKITSMQTFVQLSTRVDGWLILEEIPYTCHRFRWFDVVHYYIDVSQENDDLLIQSNKRGKSRFLVE